MVVVAVVDGSCCCNNLLLFLHVITKKMKKMCDILNLRQCITQSPASLVHLCSIALLWLFVFLTTAPHSNPATTTSLL
jgi:hypothetical protein